MDPDDSIPSIAQNSPPSSATNHALARAALVLSIFAFLPPLGLAAIVMGHIAEKRSLASLLNGRSMARAALWIAYIQLVLVLSMSFILWTAFRRMALSFQRDAIVQRFFRSSDREQPLDTAAAADAEQTARAILTELIAIQDQYRRDSKSGLYACRINELVESGVEGATEAEKLAFYQRVSDSPYMFEISWCNPADGYSSDAAYFLSAVPLHPRMPEGSAIYCADQTGTLRQVRTGLSLDCLKHGDPVP
jgi:hypothetical protein